MNANVDVLILAGGQSRRMRQPKALLPVAGTPLIEYLIKQLFLSEEQTVWIAGGNEIIFPKISQAVFIDDFLTERFQGPLPGIAAGLQKTNTDYLWVLSCDILKLPKTTLNDLISAAAHTQANIVYAQSAAGRDYPLIALWHKGVLKRLQEYLHHGQRKVMHFVHQQTHAAHVITDLKAELCNLNTQKSFKHALNLISLP